MTLKEFSKGVLDIIESHVQQCIPTQNKHRTYREFTFLFGLGFQKPTGANLRCSPNLGSACSDIVNLHNTFQINYLCPARKRKPIYQK
jgi:hypothetical protein